MTLRLHRIDDARPESDAPTVITYGPREAAMKVPPKVEPGEPSEWDRDSTGVGRQLRIDLYIDDVVSMRAQARILGEFARKVEQVTLDPSLTIRSMLLHIRHYASVARAMMEEAAPSQINRVLARKERIRRERER
jgi:hypothetical protein